MASVIPGYEYDIFISYRQNDNKGDRWVSEFVTALKSELGATFKEDVSIYFDENPHDGLLETHDVHESLSEKLKCLIFIPIISQTYCDPKSFAWNYEFLAFKKQASEDRYGLKIKLQNGNIASRILPIRIHELDDQDKVILEHELGPIRAIDFVFKAAGVNRPLLAREEHQQDNQNKIFYRDQINKVSLAVKELILAITNPVVKSGSKITAEQSSKSFFRKTGWKVAFLFALILIGYFIYRSETGIADTKELDKSIAVLPFIDLSPERNQEYLGDGLAEDIITALSKIDQLKVIGRTSSFQFKGEKMDLREVGQKLGVATLLEGSIMKSGSALRINAQLINVRDGSHIWAEQFDRPLTDLFAVHDEISRRISEKMKVTITSASSRAKPPTNNMDAYNAFVQGRYFYESNYDSSGTTKATHFFKEAIRLDSSFALPWTYLSMCYWRRADNSISPYFKTAKMATEKAVQLDPSLSVAVVNMAEILDNEYDLGGAKEKIQLALRLDPDDPYVLRNAGRFYTVLGKPTESIEFCKRALKNDPIQRAALIYLTGAYFYSRDFIRAESSAKQYEEVWGDHILIGYQYLSQFENGSALDSVSKNSNEILPGIRSGDRYEFLAISKFKSGKSKEGDDLCRQWARMCSNQCAYFIARAYAYGEQKEEALSWLEKAYSNREKRLIYLRVEPVFMKYHDEPRFKALVRKMKFPD